MAYKSTIIKISQFACEFTLRSDTVMAFYKAKQEDKERLRFCDLFDIIPNNEKITLAKEGNFQYVEISNVSNFGEVSPVNLAWEERNDLNENYFKKIEQGNILKASKGDILIPKVRPNLKKFIFIDETTEQYYYTTAFIRIRPKKNNKSLYFGLRTLFIEDIIASSRQGKGYPTINESDLSFVTLSKFTVEQLLEKDYELSDKTNEIVENITVTNAKINSESNIINKAIIKSLGINCDKLCIIDKTRTIHSSLTQLSLNNASIRNGYRWTKLQLLLAEIKDELGEYDFLRNYLVNEGTKNGWSPECNENDGNSMVLGIDSINRDGTLSFNNPKFTNETRKTIDSFIIKDGDLFLSRGNTVDLVALASIAESPEDNYIFPDIMIRVDVNAELIDKKFLAYYINSIVGRLYFKYSAKGKQQTMVKVSSTEIENLIIPKIPIQKQREIVKEIQDDFATRNSHIKTVSELRTSLDDLYLTIIQK